MIAAYYFVSTLMLIYNTIRDIHTREIDERFNYFAFGSTLMLIAYIKISLILLLVLIFLTGFLSFMFKKFMASGDLQALAWILLGFGAIDPFKIIKFLITFTGLFVLTFLIKKLMKKEKEETPGYISFLGSYIITIFW